MYIPCDYHKHDKTLEEAREHFNKTVGHQKKCLELFGLTYTEGTIEESHTDTCWQFSFVNGTAELNDEQRTAFNKLQQVCHKTP